MTVSLSISLQHFDHLIPQLALFENRIVKQEPEDRSFVADDEEFSVFVDAERARLFGARADLPNLSELAVLLRHCPDPF